jgi:hypothetical protein
MMYPTPPGNLSRMKIIPPAKLRASVEMRVGAPTFSKTVVQSGVLLTYDIPIAVIT